MTMAIRRRAMVVSRLKYRVKSVKLLKLRVYLWTEDIVLCVAVALEMDLYIMKFRKDKRNTGISP